MFAVLSTQAQESYSFRELVDGPETVLIDVTTPRQIDIDRSFIQNMAHQGRRLRIPPGVPGVGRFNSPTELRYHLQRELRNTVDDYDPAPEFETILVNTFARLYPEVNFVEGGNNPGVAVPNPRLLVVLDSWGLFDSTTGSERSDVSFGVELDLFWITPEGQVLEFDDLETKGSEHIAFGEAYELELLLGLMRGAFPQIASALEAHLNQQETEAEAPSESDKAMPRWRSQTTPYTQQD